MPVEVAAGRAAGLGGRREIIAIVLGIHDPKRRRSRS
jgi:hypothetical protein